MGLNAVDRWFFAMDAPGVSSAVAVLMTFQAPQGAPADFVRGLVQRMRQQTDFAAPFNQRLKRTAGRRYAPALETLGNDRIDLDYHLRHFALPAPGGQQDLGMLVQHIFSTPLDYTRPLWEFTVIEGLEGDRFACLFKVHHSLMDGMGAVRRLRLWLDDQPDPDKVRAFWTIGLGGSGPRVPVTRPPVAERLRTAAEATRALSRATAADLRETFGDKDPDYATAFTAPETRLNSRVSPRRRFATQTFDLDRMVAVAKGFDVTVNDVFLALCSGSLRSYLHELGELPDRSLTVAMPVSVRSADNGAANAISSILCQLRTDVEDPAERIAAIAASSRGAKERLQSLPRKAADLLGAVSMTPLALQGMVGLSGRTRAPFNLLVSNVPGPKEDLFLGSAHLHSLHPLSIVSHGQALNMSGGSFSGKFHIGVVGCPDTLPHLQRIAVRTADALQELEKALELKQSVAEVTS